MRREHYFIFKGIKSYDMDIVVTRMPTITKPPKRVSDITIPGRDGVLHFDDDSYENYTKDIEFAIVNRGRRVSYETINRWLDGYGELMFSHEKGRVYRGIIKNKIDITNVVKQFSKFLVQWDVYPLKFSATPENDRLILYTNDYKFTGNGAVEALPIIRIYGSGDVGLIINGVVHGLTNVEDHVIINSEISEVYKGSDNRNNHYNADDFPRLRPSGNENTVSWTGDVNKVIIDPNWRWL